MMSALLCKSMLSVLFVQPIDIWLMAIICVLIVLIIIEFIYFIRQKKHDKQKLKENALRISDFNKSLDALIVNTTMEVYLFDKEDKKLYKYDGADFVRDNSSLNDIETQVHPDDLEQYCNDYSDIINGVKDTVVSRLRIYNEKTNSFELFEHIVKPVKRTNQGKVTNYLYTRKNISQENLKARQQTMVNINMHLALRYGGIISWHYDVENQSHKFFDGDFKEHILSEDELIACIEPLHRDNYKLFIKRLISNQLSEQAEVLSVKLPINKDYKEYTIAAMAYFDTIEPVTILGVWKK